MEDWSAQVPAAADARIAEYAAGVKVVQPQDHRGCWAPAGQVGASVGPAAGATGAKLEAPAN